MFENLEATETCKLMKSLLCLIGKKIDSSQAGGVHEKLTSNSVLSGRTLRVGANHQRKATGSPGTGSEFSSRAWQEGRG